MAWIAPITEGAWAAMRCCLSWLSQDLGGVVFRAEGINENCLFLAIKRAQDGIAESGLCLCRKHGVCWGDGAISKCRHRDGEHCVFPCKARGS